MNHQNLILTEKSIKAHSKRLQKQLKLQNQSLSLCESQNLFAKILGFNNFHELLNIVKNKPEPSSTLLNISFPKLRNGKHIPDKYLNNPISKNKSNMLEYVLLDEEEVLENHIPENFIQLIDLVITSSLQEVLFFLEHNEVDLNYQISTRNWQPKNALEFAVFFERNDILKYLLSLKDIDLSNVEYYLLTTAAHRGHFQLFKTFCSQLPYS